MHCHVCVDAVDNNECNTTNVCDDGHSHCLTEIFFDDGALTIQKRCAKMQVCYNMEENNADECESPDDTTDGYCAYCCSTPGCNAGLPPYPTGMFNINNAQVSAGQTPLTPAQQIHQNAAKKNEQTQVTSSENNRRTNPGTQNRSTNTTPYNRTNDKGCDNRTTNTTCYNRACNTSPQQHKESDVTNHTSSSDNDRRPCHQCSVSVSLPRWTGDVCTQVHVSPNNTLAQLLGNININIQISGGQVQAVVQPQSTCPCAQQAAQEPMVTQCYQCDNSQCTSQHLTTCPTGMDYCMNTVRQEMDGSRRFEKSCVRQNVCETKWWRNTASHADCFLLDDQARGRPGMRLASCSFCCSGNGCNQHTIPAKSTLYDPNRQKTQCYQCDNSQCTSQHLTTCPTGMDYCMNTVRQEMDGTRRFEKSCVRQNVCETKWWRNTASHADCFLLDDQARGRPGMRLASCSFCCSGNGCNQHTIPAKSTLYDPNKTSSGP
ncbi:hypothetical protein BaRGS_00006201 [Batillaria attramentaria]|uniref:Sodefrin-like factor n=1 Tax=Batillaria attramentaria TaxID=370345 RepID=A0ABD0LTQ7_9CAEN